MTTTEEEIWALTEAEEFLCALTRGDKVGRVSDLRREASRILRHFPNRGKIRLSWIPWRVREKENAK